MGLFGRDDDGRPPLPELWRTIAPSYAAIVDERGEESVMVTGTARGRTFEVDIESRRKRLEALHRIGQGPREKAVYRTWRSSLAVSCANPHRLQGTLKAFVDVRDPSWDPRNFDPANGRRIVVEPPELASRLAPPSVQERLMQVRDDVTIVVDGGLVRIDDEQKAKVEIGYFGGCVFHQRPGPVGPDRFVSAPPWWIDLLCDIADSVDA
jgi:hypothetical protein